MQTRAAVVVSLTASAALVGSEAGAQTAGLRLGLAPLTHKVLKHNPVAALPAEGIELWGARGEKLSVQLVLTAGRGGLEDVQVSLTQPPRAVDGSPEASLPVELFRVAYVPDPAHAAARDTHIERWQEELKDPNTDAYPDPLPPLSGPLELTAGENQPVWVKVAIPDDCRSGEYRGELTVSAAGTAQPVPLRVHVWPFTLPSTPSLRTAFGNWPSPTALEGVQADSPEQQRLAARYYETLLAHRISGYYLPQPVNTPEGVAYARDPRVTSFLAGGPDLEALEAHGLLAQALFYPGDEPLAREQYESLQAAGRLLHEQNPDAAIVTPFWGRGYDDNSPVDLLTGTTSVWVPQTSLYLEDAKVREQLLQRKALGEQVWTYVCCGPGGAYCNFFTHMEGIRHRLLFWQVRQAQLDGLLYWSTQYWERVNPWESMETYQMPDGSTFFGDGSLLYPGKPVGVEGPVSSQRLECILAGMQDVEYFELLRRAEGEAAVQQALGEMVTDFVTYSLDEEKLEQVRRRIGERLAAVARDDD